LVAVVILPLDRTIHRCEVDITAANIYNGVYELRSNSLVRHKILISKNLAFLTTFEHLGFGIRTNLYAFDITHKLLIRDPEFRRYYLYSSAGINVIEPKSNRIFSVDKSGVCKKKMEFIIPAGLYEVEDWWGIK
jgi:hypothetical protein